LDESIRINYDGKIYAKIRKAAGLTGSITAPDSAKITSGAFRSITGDARPDEIKVFDYIYGVLHCPSYRTTYGEFLKIGFPRVPFPTSPDVFRTISNQGEELRRLHLMEDAVIEDNATYRFEGDAPEGQDCLVDRPRFEDGPCDLSAIFVQADIRQCRAPKTLPARHRSIGPLHRYH
jgi:predicted helicase